VVPVDLKLKTTEEKRQEQSCFIWRLQEQKSQSQQIVLCPIHAKDDL
jgi:hypothetical protein